MGDGFSTHYVVLAYQTTLDLTLHELPKAQHTSYRWWGEHEMPLADTVHRHTKWYVDGGGALQS